MQVFSISLINRIGLNIYPLEELTDLYDPLVKKTLLFTNKSLPIRSFFWNWNVKPFRIRSLTFFNLRFNEYKTCMAILTNLWKKWMKNWKTDVFIRQKESFQVPETRKRVNYAQNPLNQPTLLNVQIILPWYTGYRNFLYALRHKCSCRIYLLHPVTWGHSVLWVLLQEAIQVRS